MKKVWLITEAETDWGEISLRIVLMDTIYCGVLCKTEKCSAFLKFDQFDADELPERQLIPRPRRSPFVQEIW
jgi:hypothetical protein